VRKSGHDFISISILVSGLSRICEADPDSGIFKLQVAGKIPDAKNLHGLGFAVTIRAAEKAV
jgi:hypothetical protein